MKLQRFRYLCMTIAASALLAACQTGGPAEPDAAPPPPDMKPDPQPPPPAPPDEAPYQECGDGLVTGEEECDDGNDSNDDACLNDCTHACGDGIVNAIELCDTGIESGEGACPTECDDGDTCTVDVLSGDNCQSQCIFTPITVFVDGDGCCPPGGNANVDSDCLPVCGNGVLEPGEQCDIGIAPGERGACPQSAAECDDAQVCTTDELLAPGTCSATCRHTEITEPISGDGCCPQDATVGTDSDCSADCGDGVWSPEAGETCDTAILPGAPGACPTVADCNDGDACTVDSLLSAGTCNAQCVNRPITEVGPADGCCPPGANANSDPDCTPECGNNVIEDGEECDDGNTEPNDGCDASCKIEIVPSAFRLRTLELRDPHAFTEVFFFCMDITSKLNDEFAKAVTRDSDSPPDGLLDLNAVQIFRPLTQGSTETPFEFRFADCTAPLESTRCTAGDAAIQPVLTMATNRATGTCLGPEPGTVRPYNPGVTSATGPCYASAPETLHLDIEGIQLTLTNAQIGGTYVGNPAERMVNGLIRGFISEADANMITLPANLPVVGGAALSSILRGGRGNCASGSDKDMGPGGVPGWWLYFNFTASAVPWSEP